MTREEQLACLKDRPCDVCKMRTDKGCSSWECVFEQTPDEEKEPCDCIIRANVEKIKEIMTDINGDSVYVARMKDIRALPSIQPTAKENLVVEDCISREEVCDYIAEFVNHEYATDRERELVKNIIDGIQHLPSIQPKTKTECSCEQIKWERDIAIEQLHELGYELGQKIEPCEDCISRQEALKCFTWTNTKDDVYYGIKALSSIQPKLKTGRWIGHREHCENLGVMPSGLGAYEWCSNCDCGIDLREWHRNNYNFCPNCGAKMLPTDSEKE